MPEKDLLSENDFHALLAITDSDMLDDDEITSANVEQILLMKKIIKRALCDKSFHIKSKAGWTH